MDAASTLISTQCHIEGFSGPQYPLSIPGEGADGGEPDARPEGVRAAAIHVDAAGGAAAVGHRAAAPAGGGGAGSWLRNQGAPYWGKSRGGKKLTSL